MPEVLLNRTGQDLKKLNRNLIELLRRDKSGEQR